MESIPPRNAPHDIQYLGMFRRFTAGDHDVHWFHLRPQAMHRLAKLFQRHPPPMSRCVLETHRTLERTIVVDMDEAVGERPPVPVWQRLGLIPELTEKLAVFIQLAVFYHISQRGGSGIQHRLPVCHILHRNVAAVSMLS